ncbi:MAG: leucine-rich repeat protein, partial [Bacilli bacterium]|nr:leucine-rich repeat protein [Bacilli bacterium]
MCNKIKEFNGIKYREDNNEITITGYLGMDENLNIPSEIDGKKVIGIEDKTAAWSSALKSITIPDTVIKIEGGVLKNCKDLVSIKVDENNKNYADKDGVLFTKDEKVLIKYPKGKMEKGYVIPDTVTRIEDWAFYDSNLMLIENSDKVTEI